LKKELGDVETEFETFVAKDLDAVNKSLAKKKIETVEPLTRKQWEAATGSGQSGSSSSASSFKMHH
ncbi:MAG TPA: hypothetical protein VH140_04050, partial [Candidatus Acidoferrum sp.]|nr:hypothetical protein [Candidatus Acidoferrum sp.]